jgi:hypothetical protein
MSLQLAAQHLAAQGRGPDKQLVHMSPREVAGLQALAMSQGGSLSINPKTGLPEAGFLDNLLPAIIGAGLMFATGGTAAPLVAGISNPALIGLGIGGLETLRTGDLNRGIMAGLGAYGGAGLAGPFAAAGPGFTVASPQAMSQATALAEAAPAAQAGVTGAATPFEFGMADPSIGLAEQAEILRTGQAIPGATQAAEAAGRQGVMDFMANRGIGLGPTGEIVSVTPPVSMAAPAAPVDAISRLSPGDMALRTAPYEVAPAAATNTAQEAFRASEIAARNASPTFAERFAAMPGKDLAKYGLAAAAPSLLAPPEYKQPELDRTMYRYAYTPGRVADPEAGYTGAMTGERMYFQPQYARLAKGGPVEAMSAANVYDMQRARGGVSDLGVDMSTGQERMARGGISHLGDYSDGGRLLRGPGDGVSDSIPATIANKRPARLADGEFVVPARIVSELGNGSTEAGARKLYAMMDRVQRARGKTTGKGRVAKNTRSEKYLPA